MDKDFEPELKGTLEQAINAQQQILKYFIRCGESGHQDAHKHQLVFACKISSVITKCKEKHLDIYFHIITETFGDKLKPECNLKYWTLYVNCIRYIHYTLVTKKEYEMASAIYKYISSFKNKLQSTDIGITILNIYAAQLLLQISLKSSDNKTAFRNANDVIENLTKLFKELLDKNKQFNFQYPDILKTTLLCLFPRNTMASVFKFMNLLSAIKVKKMFTSLFTLYGQQTIDPLPSQDEVQCHAQFVIETLYNLLQIDITDKFELQLTLELLSQCRREYRLQSYKPIADLLLTLYDYLKLLFNKNSDSCLPSVFNERIERFKKLFDENSKLIMSQRWFGDLLVLLCNIHYQLQNNQIFPYFWHKMSKPDCYRAIFQLFTECIKLASCISGETKLFPITCCTSIRKHAILSFAQTAISFFVFYCQNVAANEEEKEEEFIKCGNNSTDSYKETIQKPLIKIVNHALKIINNMECITSTSQDLNILLTRFKQATINAKTSRQAGTCLSICELFLNIKTKIPSHEWPLLLRRLYKVVTEHVISEPNLGRDLQMCYIASMMDKSIEQIDIGKIQTQINIFYTAKYKTPACVPHESCLMQLYYTTTCLFRPHLEPTRKKLLHWLESQYILKYSRSNAQLLHSLLKHSQSQYDFVIIAREFKLETYALDKISSLCKTFSSKSQQLDGLRRLQQLTYGHALTMLTMQQFKSPKLQVNSKDLNEENLDQLLLREEMSSMTINDELKRVKIAVEAFKAFEQFYEKFDSEAISMDEAIVDWECILEDLASLADYLQLSGYLEYCSQLYLLLYKFSRLLQNDKYALKCLAFFCEYSEYYETNSTEETALNIDNEIELNFNAITVALENVSTIDWTKLNIILLAVVQIAYYYARSNRYTLAKTLLQYVEQNHFESPERQGAYDIVLATLDAVKFRLIWKNFENNNSNTAEKTIRERCLLFEMEETLERFHDFKYGNERSTDALIFAIFAVNLVLEYSECTANRLCDNFIISLLHLTIKISLHYGLALRLVHVMSRWMWVNLQMEYVDKAQTKLKFIQYVMCAKSLKELTNKCDKAKIDIHSNIVLQTPSKELLPLNCNNNNMETMRKLVLVQLSPIKTGKLQLSPASRNNELNRYLNCKIDTKLMPQNEIIEWTYFTVGCLNARLYFLVEDYDQLEIFYENTNKWLQNRQNSFNKQYYTNIQLLAMQHYINFLRSQRQYEKALKYLKFAIEMCDSLQFKIDVVYNINFETQLSSTKKALESTKTFENLNQIRRVLEFNLQPECNSELHEKSKNKLKETIIKKAVTSNMTEGKTLSSLKTFVSGSAAASSKKPKTQSSSISSGSTSSLDTKSLKPKQKLKFDICEDSIEILDSDDSVNEFERPILEIIDSDECKNNSEGDEEVKTTKRTKTIDIKDQRKTPKISKTVTKTTSIAEKKNKIKSPPVQQLLEIDLTDSPLATRLPTSSATSSASSLDQLETNEHVDLVQQMKHLEVDVVKKSTVTGTKPKKRVHKPALAKQLSAPLIILTDSPSGSGNSTNSKVANVKKSSRLLTTAPIRKPLETRLRRQRHLILENDENFENNDMPPTSSSVASSSSAVSSRRRQKI